MHVHKIYHTPKSPYQRLLDSPDIHEETKSRLQQQFLTLDLIALLHGIREAQSNLASYSLTKNYRYEFKKDNDTTKNSLNSFLRELESTWEKGEIRPTSVTEGGLNQNVGGVQDQILLKMLGP